MRINSNNEWSKLKSVVVGSATNANWPSDDPVFALESQKTTWQATPIPSGPVPDWIIAEANEDLDVLASTLEQLGVEVWRPAVMNFQQLGGMYNYCPRDRLLVYGDTIVDTTMMYPCRDMEYQCYIDYLDEADRIIHMPRNAGMTLDAANILRITKDKWLFLESSSGNRAAYDWLCKQLPEVDIELCNFYAGVHIDSTIVPIRNKLVLLNGTRVNEDNCPKALKDWEKIWIHDVLSQGFYEYPYASKWIAMNMLVVDPHTVICDRNQIDLIDISHKT